MCIFISQNVCGECGMFSPSGLHAPAFWVVRYNPITHPHWRSGARFVKGLYRSLKVWTLDFMHTFYLCCIPSHSSYAFSFETGIFAIWRFKRVYQTAAISSPKLFFLRCLSIKKNPRKKQVPRADLSRKKGLFSSWGPHWSIDLVTSPNPTKLHRPAKNAPRITEV